VIASAHTAAGVASGMIAASLVRHPVARAATAFILGILTHVVLDALPHGDYGELSMAPVLAIVVAELVATGFALTWILRTRVGPGWPVYLAAGFIGGALPDIKFLASLVLSRDGAAAVASIGDRFHEPFHAGPSALGVGVTVEVIATLVMVALLTRLPRRATT
jgi:hypothetical protein